MQTMDGIFTNLKRMFQSGNILSKLIYINVGLFILIRLASVLFMLFNVQGVPFLQYLQLPASPELLLFRPWTLFTYMFTHFDFLHILFNMLWLYWFGGLFLNFFNERQLGGLYILGGLAGAILFVLAYNIFPYFQNVASFSYLMGASASVMAIVFAVSFYRKDLEINLFLIGRIKLIYLAIFTLVIDLLAMTSDNAGGHIAHIGGALFGMWFASRIRNGKDLTAPMNRLIDWFVNLGKRKPKMRVTYKRNETDYEYNARKHQESVDLDTILDKLKRSGYESLSAEESFEDLLSSVPSFNVKADVDKDGNVTLKTPMSVEVTGDRLGDVLYTVYSYDGKVLAKESKKLELPKEDIDGCLVKIKITWGKKDTSYLEEDYWFAAMYNTER